MPALTMNSEVYVKRLDAEFLINSVIEDSEKERLQLEKSKSLIWGENDTEMFQKLRDGGLSFNQVHTWLEGFYSRLKTLGIVENTQSDATC